MRFLYRSYQRHGDRSPGLRVLCAVLAVGVGGCATPGEPGERAQAVFSSNLVHSFEQLVKDTSAAAPDAPAVLLRIELPRLGLLWDGAGGPGVLGGREAARQWTMPIQHWKRALNRCAIMCEDRLPL